MSSAGTRREVGKALFWARMDRDGWRRPSGSDWRWVWRGDRLAVDDALDESDFKAFRSWSLDERLGPGGLERAMFLAGRARLARLKREEARDYAREYAARKREERRVSQSEAERTGA